MNTMLPGSILDSMDEVANGGPEIHEESQMPGYWSFSSSLKSGKELLGLSEEEVTQLQQHADFVENRLEEREVTEPAEGYLSRVMRALPGAMRDK